MYITALALTDFRNFAKEKLAFSPELNLIWGDNAQGKTNLLEAVFFFGGGKSFRAGRDRELVRFTQEMALLEAEISSQGRPQSLEIRLFTNARRQLFAGGAKLSARDMVGKLPAVFFGPEELEIVRAGALLRRRFLDVALCQLRPRYLAVLSEYTRVHAHKTKLLRTPDPTPALRETLPVYNRRMAELGSLLMEYRAAFCEAVSAEAEALHRDIAGGREALRVRYVPCMPLEGAETTEHFYDALCCKEAAEWRAGLCLFGPHRDDLEITVGGVSARQYASQGQARTAALSLKLAERALFASELGEPPVLLLDDVFSELDVLRQDYILRHLSGGQILLTCCDPGRVRTVHIGNDIHVEGGRIV